MIFLIQEYWLCHIPITFPSVLWHCWLGDRKGIRPVKSWVLVCSWWRFDWSFACSNCHYWLCGDDNSKIIFIVLSCINMMQQMQRCIYHILPPSPMLFISITQILFESTHRHIWHRMHNQSDSRKSSGFLLYRFTPCWAESAKGLTQKNLQGSLEHNFLQLHALPVAQPTIKKH